MSTEPDPPKPPGSDEPNVGPYRDAPLHRPRERWSIAAIGSAIGAVVGLGLIVAGLLSANFFWAAENRATVLVGLVTLGIVCFAFSVVIAKTVDEELNQVSDPESEPEIVRGRRLARATLMIGKTVGLFALVALALVLVAVFLVFLTCMGR